MNPLKVGNSVLIYTDYSEGLKLASMLESTEKNGDNYIIDGHHRYFAAKKLKHETIKALILNITFEFLQMTSRVFYLEFRLFLLIIKLALLHLFKRVHMKG